MARLYDNYKNEVINKLKKEFNYKNIMEVPKIEKVVLNMGVGEATQNIKILDSATEELTLIAGQKAVIKRAKKSVATFKLREGMPIACMVTLRKDKMYEFLDKLINIALPRVKDFRGVSKKAFDGRGNYSLGIREHLIFPELEYDKVDKVKGIGVNIVTTAKTDEESKKLLELLGMPFRK